MKVELLAPGGSYECVIAALNAGADAVYTGGELFGARASADNLTTEQLIDAINYAHLHDKKIYLTINTLIKDNEIKNQLFEYIKPLYEAGLDAVIVQDIGVIKFVNKHFPELHIHASTQMTIMGYRTAKELKKYNVTRIVTPRELSLCEINDIKENVDIEIESFVHGALCYCYSGQCLLSSFIGGRSGNRGRCAQPCRMEYDVVYDGHVLNQGDSKYVISPKDICTLNILPEIIESGVFSLKIEGRMKKLEYVAGVVSIYRKYIDLYLSNSDNYRVEKEDIDKLNGLFNRNGFSESYYKTHNGREMISLKKPSFRAQNKEYVDYLINTYSGKKLKEKINIEVLAKIGQPLFISVNYKDCYVSASGEIIEVASNNPTQKETVLDKVSKLGNTDFEADHIDILMDDNAFVRIGDLNNTRRTAIKLLEEEIINKFKNRCIILPDNFVYKVDETTKERNINVLVSNIEQLNVIRKYDVINRIYLDYSVFKNIKDVDDLKSLTKEIYLAMPYIFRKKDIKQFSKTILKYLDIFDGVLIRNIEQYYFLKDLNVEFNYIFDYNVYTYNQIAKYEYALNNIETTIPLELNFRELMERECDNEEFIIYGYIPMMISANCGMKTSNMCMHNDDIFTYRDTKGNSFKTKCVCDYCYNIMYNSKALSLFKHKNEIDKLNVSSIRLNFTLENRSETEKVINNLIETFVNDNIIENENTTRGHFKRGVL